MKILAMEHEIPGKSPEDFGPHLKTEAARLWELYQAGLLRELYFRADRHEAVLVLECSNLDHAQEILASLPLVRQELISFEMIPLLPYSGFSRLWTDNEN